MSEPPAASSSSSSSRSLLAGIASTAAGVVAHGVPDDDLAALQGHLGGVGVASADALERSIVDQVERQMAEHDREDDARRLAAVQKKINTAYAKLSTLEDRVEAAPTSKRSTLRRQMRTLSDEIQVLLEEEEAVKERMQARDAAATASSSSSSRPQPHRPERRRDTSPDPLAERARLIREGKITPFASDDQVRQAVAAGRTNVATLKRDFVDYSDGDEEDDEEVDIEAGSSSSDAAAASKPAKRRRLVSRAERERNAAPSSPPPRPPRQRASRRQDDDDDGFIVSDASSDEEDAAAVDSDASEFDPDRVESDGDDDEGLDAAESDSDFALDDEDRPRRSRARSKSKSKPTRARTSRREAPADGAEPLAPQTHYSEVTDDGLEEHYQRRLRRWAKRNYRERTGESASASDTFDAAAEIHLPGSAPDLAITKEFAVPGAIHPHLFQYQVTCLRWLWELHTQRVGGIIGDEMGLGKTTQTVSFLASLVYSGQMRRPSLIVCPATVLQQWVKEFHQWFAPMRVVVLHSSGAGVRGRKEAAAAAVASKKHKRRRRAADDDDEDISVDSEEEDDEGAADDPFAKFAGVLPGDRDEEADARAVVAQYDEGKVQKRKSVPWVRDLVQRVVRDGHVLVTTYAGIRHFSADLLPVEWGYVVLDEGHQIRNPDAEITIVCKQLRTPHRIILSGTPIQNNLAELWSLFDFVYPGRLGTLPVFQSEFAVPINIGGYANASNVQVQTAYKCACVLRDLIQPYMLRRMKADVAQDLPTKSEQVLFCKLSPSQRALYKQFLESKEAGQILEGKRNSLYGIDALRKVCNHPRLLSSSHPLTVDESGKLVVVRELLRSWSALGHKVLLFSQTRQMLDIIEHVVREIGYEYRRMDGNTPVKARAALVDEFNNTPDLFLFLLTTKVGGLGVNLTGANRIIIYDPDWNPTTDLQAMNRAWRLGQTRHVTIYRLMTTGSLEEKIYHRQIFKTHLSAKVLSDPKQRRYFRLHDLRDLFTLAPEHEGPSRETAKLAAEGRAAQQPETKADEELVREIEGVARLEPLRIGEGENGATTAAAAAGSEANGGGGAESAAASSETHILASLMGSTGVETAIQHDAAMSATRPEFIIVEQEAQRVADAAIAALKASRATRRGIDVSVPTWTGRSGDTGVARPGQRAAAAGPTIAGRRVGAAAARGAAATGPSSSGAASSAGLLAGLRGARPATPSGSSSAPATASTSPAAAASAGPPVRLDAVNQEDLLFDMRDHLASLGGAATSADIVRRFRLKLTSEDVVVFRKLLSGIARFEKRNGAGWWRLKPDFM
ncbi:DNA repair protein rhp26 [Blastocladiella emersonii ATCC 22665]|nr:DNA repair protein rhp26 [Blastocladiella emersonii ATCC 22665]